MASAARFEQELKTVGTIKRLATIDKGNPVIARLREELVKSAEREDLESLAQKTSEEHKHELREARLDGVASCVGFILLMLLILSLVGVAVPFVSKDEKGPPKPESKSLEEKVTPRSGSTRIYCGKANKADPETSELKCTCHRCPLELDNTRVL
ncbi:hypothetical protein IWW34DRAFT_871259 [Fusarium oxysporum f. sp. albedinis]|nr:hypothetical protein IWW34DRAFT_871259 [Fusarium oxysporum f. sp. albedinis]KAK2481001.1 hypothetical protein H9L39_06640 [Fusarium oxysporum f. sp. albedinis]